MIDVAEKIPLYLKEFLKNLSDGNIYLSGAYTLGEKYDLSILETLPVYIHKVKERININGKDKEFNKILLVGDMFFCLFDQEFFNRNNLTLTFWSNIRSLVTIKKTIKGDSCRFFWKQKSKNKLYEQILIVPEESNKLLDLLLTKMKNFGINYKISKTGVKETPKSISIDIEVVEATIKNIEDEMRLNPNGVHLEYLLELYSNAIEYYSATNNPLCDQYAIKTKELMNNQKYQDLLINQKEVNSKRKLEKSDHIHELIEEKTENKNELINYNNKDNIEEYENEIGINIKHQEDTANLNTNNIDKNEVIKEENTENNNELSSDGNINNENKSGLSPNENEQKIETDTVNKNTFQHNDNLNIEENDESKNLPNNESLGKVEFIDDENTNLEKQNFKIYDEDDEDN